MNLKNHEHRRHGRHAGMGHSHEPRQGGELRRMGRGGRRRRIFDQSDLQTLLLSLLKDQPRHGYELIRAIETQSGGQYVPSPGMVYPALTYLEESGAIAVQGDEGARKSYAVTEQGAEQLAERSEEITRLGNRLTDLANERERTDPAPVKRAMQNLKTAVLNRLSHEEASRDLVLQITDLIDEAARKIERIDV